MTLRSDMITELERAFTDVAYDGGMGELNGAQFTRLVSQLAEAAEDVMKVSLDARWEHSDHTAAKYYRRMRDVEREMHSRELHHFEEEQKSDALAGRIGRSIVAVQDGEPEHVVLGMLRGELAWDFNTVVPTKGADDV